jgi:DNA-binding transcriptional regulator PaaX
MPFKENNYESLVDLLLATIGSGRSARRFRSILFERKLKRYKKESIKVALSRLRSKGYLDNSTSGWYITQKGKKYIVSKELLGYIASPFAKNSLPEIIISFDIPEHSRTIRNWLRNQIKIFGYKMLQQSLWIGPGPLPLSFLKRIEDLGIRKNIKTFKINKKI